MNEVNFKIEAWRDYCEALIEMQSLYFKMEFTCNFPDTDRDGFTEEEIQKEIDRASQKLEYTKNKLLDLGEKLPENESKFLKKYSLTDEESDNHFLKFWEKMERIQKEASETRYVTNYDGCGYSIKKYNINTDKEILAKIDREKFWRENGLFIGVGIVAIVLSGLVTIQFLIQIYFPSILK